MCCANHKDSSGGQRVWFGSSQGDSICGKLKPGCVVDKKKKKERSQEHNITKKSQVDLCEFEASLVYKASFRTAKAM